MSRACIAISSRRKVRFWRAAFGVRATREKSGERPYNHGQCRKEEGIGVTESPASDYTHVINIGSSPIPIGIPFP
jgi:hypothetical protein